MGFNSITRMALPRVVDLILYRISSRATIFFSTYIKLNRGNVVMITQIKNTLHLNHIQIELVQFSHLRNKV